MVDHNRSRYLSEWYQRDLIANREKRRANWAKSRNKVLVALGQRCSKCGWNEDSRALHVDHVNGGGNQDRKKRGHCPQSLFRDINENPGKYQLLCANCNWIKRHEEKEMFGRIKYGLL